MNLRNKIGYFHWLLKTRHKYRKEKWSFVELEPGDYYVSCNIRTFLFKKGIPDKFLSMIGMDEKKARLRALHIRAGKDNKSKYQAQVVMSTNNGYRFFNYDDRTTLHFFSDEKERLIYQRVSHVFSPEFNVPIKEITDSYSVDSIIDNKPRRYWSEIEIKNNFYKLFEKYNRYLFSSIVKKVSLKEWVNRYSFSSNVILNQLIGEVMEDVRPLTNISLVFSHGDMHFGNIFYKEDEIYLSDFERSGEEVFFFDIFNVIYVEYIDWHNEAFLKSYLMKDEKIIGYFKELFRSVGKTFDISLSKKYFELFLLFRLINDLADREKKDDQVKLDDIIGQKVERFTFFRRMLNEE